MLCQNCNVKEANVHITKITNGAKTEMHYCDECAKNKQEIGISSIGFVFPLSFQNIVDGLFEVMSPTVEHIDKVVSCPVCGMTFENFRNNGKVGCSNCYNTFSSNMLPLIKRIHGNIQHLGKVPKRTGGMLRVGRDIDKLREDLRISVKNEEYEKAASLRDKIRNLENELNNLEK